MANELVIPPDLTPESPESTELVDDQTFTFRPQFGRAWMQRNSYGDPRWQFVRRYRGLRQKDRARLQAVLNEAQGAYRTIMVSPAQAPSGTWVSVCGAELFVNSDFSNGTTGWTVGPEASIAVSSSVLRVTRTLNTGVGYSYAYETVAPVANAPHVLRMVCGQTRGPSTVRPTVGGNFIGLRSDSGSNTGYHWTSFYDPGGGGNAYLDNTGAAISMAGDYYEVTFASVSRCMLSDSGGNLLQRSDEFDNAYWTPSAASIGANAAVAPDGTTTAEYLRDQAGSGNHYVVTSGTVAVSASAADYSFSVAISVGNRQWNYLQIIEGLGNTAVTAWFDVVNGVLGTATNGTNFLNARASMAPLGSGWYRCTVTGRKTNASTTLQPVIGASTANGNASYVGVPSQVASVIWRATLTSSSVPAQLVQSTSAAVAASAQSGPSIYVKGLPASQTGLLVAGDWVEIDGQLKQLTASLDSDASGLGYLQFRPKIARAVADSTPVIVTKPVGRFMLGGNAKWDGMFGLNIDSTITLDEVYE